MLLDFLSVSLSTTIVILLFAIFTLVLPKKMSASCRYFIWLLIALRLIIPVNISLGFAPIQIPPEPLTQVSEHLSSPSSDMVASAEGQIHAEISSGAKSLQAVYWLIGLWLLGALVFSGYYLLRYYLFCRQIRPWCKEVSFEGNVPVIQCKIIATPMLIGIFHPRILLPANQYDAETLSMVIQHEMTHYQRKDIWYKWLLLLVNAIHWFNPAVYLFRKYANRDLEFSCDEKVLKGQNTAYKQKYAQLILSTAAFKESIPLGTCLKSSQSQLKSRLLNIAGCGGRKNIVFPIIVMVLLAFCSTAVLANSTEKDFLQKLNPFLPISVTENMDYYRVEKNDSGAFTLWGELQGNSENFLHDIQITEEKGILTSYIYKDYGFLAENMAESPISLQEGENLANLFAEIFLAKEGSLVFSNAPYENHLYDPGHVESYIAQGNNTKYVIMVNLDYGIVVNYEKI